MAVGRDPLVTGESLGAVVRNRHPRELEVPDRLVQTWQALVDPRGDVGDGGVLAVRPLEHQGPLLPLASGRPQSRQLSKHLGEGRRLDRGDRIDGPTLDERRGVRDGRIEPLLHRLLGGRERSQVPADTFCAGAAGHGEIPSTTLP